MINDKPATHKEFAEGAVTLVLGTLVLVQPSSSAEFARVGRLAAQLIEALVAEYIERTIAAAVATADAKLGEL